MERLSDWLALYWFVLLPVAFAAGGVVLLRRYRLARQRGLLSPFGFIWHSTALAGSQIFLWSALAAAFFSTALWPAIGAGVGITFLCAGTFFAAGTTHPALRRFLRPLPRDGIEFLQWGSPRGLRRRRFVWVLRTFTPLAPAVIVCVFVLLYADNRSVGNWSALAAVLSPLLVIPHRRLILPLLLLPIAFLLGQGAVVLRDALPAGRWTTTMTAANCSSHVRFTLERSQAWCVSSNQKTVYRFSPTSGFVSIAIQADEAVDVIGVGEDIAWVVQYPLQNLLRIQDNKVERDRFLFPGRGSVDASDRLWVIGASQSLGIVDPGQPIQWLNSQDGLLGNTANVVRPSPEGGIWVGSIGGLSFRENDSSPWQLLSRRDGVPGSVHDIALGQDGALWILWKDFGTSRGQEWGVSSFQDEAWEHFLLGDTTGLDPPITSDSLAIDEHGRIWFTAVSYASRSIYLGVFSLDQQKPEIHRLGPLDNIQAMPPSWHGVVDDGAGGIYLYNPSRAPLRHWRP